MYWLLIACGTDAGEPRSTDDTGTADPVESDPPDTDVPTDTAETADTGLVAPTGTTTDAYGCVTDHDQPLDTDCPCWTELDATLAGRGSTDTGTYGIPQYGDPAWAPCSLPSFVDAEDQLGLDAVMAAITPGAVPIALDFTAREALLLWATCGYSARYDWEVARVCEADGRAVVDLLHGTGGLDVPTRPWWVLDLPRADYSGVEVRVIPTEGGY